MNMIFPVIAFTKGDKKMWSMKNLIAGKDLLKKRNEWNSNIEVIDVMGNLFSVKKIEQDSGVLLWESIKNVGFMVKAKPVFDKEPIVVSLNDLKLRIKNHVKSNKVFWSSLNDGRGINKMIDEKNTYEDLITLFL